MKFKQFIVAVFVGLVGLTASAQALSVWKSIFISGDDSIDNFDNSREDLSLMLSQFGNLAEIHLSSSDKFISEHVYPATIENIAEAFSVLQVAENEGCFVHMSSHGAKNGGFYLSRSGGVMSPQLLSDMVNRACGEAPTVLLISACYSGQFITDQMVGPNRVILTAARADRPSFGCSADTQYTYWDGCLLQELPRLQKWTDLYENVRDCIAQKESALGAPSSDPQAFFGENTLNWSILR